MSHTPFDRHPTYFPLEDGESLSYENHVPPRNPSYPQATPRSVYRYVEPSHPPPSPLFGAGIQNQGAMNQYVGHVPEPSTRFHNELIPDWAPNDAPPVAPEIMVYGTWNNVQVADMNGFYPGYPSPSAGRVSQEPTFTRAPTEGFTPRSSRHGPSDNASLPNRMQCEWRDCTSSSTYGRPSSLWRHIREKHIFPDAFRCSVPRCERSFGRGDKLQEHLRSHENKESRKGSKCLSCHA